MPARREAADGNLEGVNTELCCVAADVQNCPRCVDQRLPAQRRLGIVLTAGVGQDKDVIACLQKLHGDGVSLARAAPGVAAARQN